MGLSSELISQYAKLVTGDKKQTTTEKAVYGTVVMYNGKPYVKLDGSDLLTPVQSTSNVSDDDRVKVEISNHTATITGNLSDPSASGNTVAEIGDKITEFEIVIADKVSVKEFDAERGRINELVADNVIIKDKLTASEVLIGKLTADNVVIKETLTANDASIKKLETEKLDATIADIKYATISDLDATNAEIYNLEAVYGDFEVLVTDRFEANEASIKDLDTKKLSVEEAEVKYANIDFANIGEAAIEKLFSDSGIIKDLVMSEGHITGKLVGVTIVGDLIEGGTVKADKLVVLGNDGLYYKLNVDAEKVSAKQTDYNSLNGKIITAKSITAEKVNVDDLVAFDATIGGFNITDSAIYSGVKNSIDNTTRGSYLDKTGQMAFGDADEYIKYYKTADGSYKLDISASNIRFGAKKKTVETAMNELQSSIDNIEIGGRNLIRNSTNLLFYGYYFMAGATYLNTSDGYILKSSDGLKFVAIT